MYVFVTVTDLLARAVRTFSRLLKVYVPTKLRLKSQSTGKP
jgi:hypothetical protein